MSRIFCCGLASVVLISLGSGQNPGALPKLVDTLGSFLDQGGALQEPDIRSLAPIVVVASVLENRVAIANTPSARIPAVALDLHLVRCRLENSLRTTQTISNAFDFYYFGMHSRSDWNPRYKTLFQALPGKRYIFFLSAEGNVLRSVGDVGEYSILISSGSHPGYSPPTERERSGNTLPGPEGLGRSIADILLREGGQVDVSAFSSSLFGSAIICNHWGSRYYDSQLLRALTNKPEPIRRAPCRVLTELFNSQYDCLFEIKNDANESAELRDWATRALENAARQDNELIRQLEDPASIESLNIDFPDSRNHIFEELQTLLRSPNEIIRTRACIALNRYFPHQAVPCR
jgi:hypothetical protein